MSTKNNKIKKQSSTKENWYTLKGDNSVKFVVAPFWKGANSKRKEFASKGNKFFPFSVTHFQKGTSVQEYK